MDEEKDDEIIIGVNIPKEQKKKVKKRKNKGVVKKATSNEKKNKVRIKSNNPIFRNRIIKRILILFVFIIALVLFLLSDFFDIKEIIVENNELVSKEEIISSMAEYNNIFSVNSTIIRNKLKENPYIQDVKFTRLLPNKVKIEVEERKTKYMIQFGSAYVYLNNQGYILDISNEKKEFPILLGIKTDLSELQKGNRLIAEDLKKLDMVNRIHEIANNNSILALISKIDISDIKNYTLYLESEKKIVYLGDCSDLNTRILYVKAILEQESGIEGEIFVNIDLNKDNVFFREKI